MKEAILRKARESAELKLRFAEENAEQLEACARAMAERLGQGGRLWVMGNGGSSCDAEHIAVEFVHPIIEKRKPFPAMALSSGMATLTAIGNDADFSHVFSQQLSLWAAPPDVVLGISTSGQSANVVRGFKVAREKGLLRVGFAGRDGGRFPDLCDHCFTVNSWSIHRIQEVHTLLVHLLWDQIHVALGEDDVL